MSRRPARGRLVGLAVLAVSLYYAVWGGEYSAPDLLRLRRERRVAQDSLALERVAVDSLRVVAERLEHDPATLERVARERFGMIRDGELLYRFVRVERPAARGP